jgi:hypothetical protein
MRWAADGIGESFSPPDTRRTAMEKYRIMPGQVVDGWPSEDVHHLPGSEPVDFHYHDVEEWLEVLEGTITFFTAGERRTLVAAFAMRMHSSWAKR